MLDADCVPAEAADNAANQDVSSPPPWWPLQELLHGAGIDVDAVLLPGLCGGAGFVAGRGALPDESSWLTGWDPEQSSLETGAAHLGLVASLHETNRAGRAAERLEALLSEGLRVAVWLDRSALAAPGLQGAGVAIVERERDQLTALLAPSVSRCVTPDQLAEARGAIRTQRHRLLAMEPGEIDLPRAVRGGLAMTAVGGLGRKQRDHGPSGVAQLASRVGGTGRSDWARRFAAPGELAAALHALITAIEREDGLWRAAQAAYERRASELLGIPGLQGVADAHDALAQRWRAVAASARASTANGGGDGRVDGDALAQLARQLAEIADEESAALELLRAALRAA